MLLSLVIRGEDNLLPPLRLLAFKGTLQPSNDSQMHVAVQDFVATVELRAGRLNSLNAPVFKRLRDTFTALHSDPEVRVVVLQGSGKYFTAGLDLCTVTDMVPNGADAAREGLKFIAALKEWQGEYCIICLVSL